MKRRKHEKKEVRKEEKEEADETGYDCNLGFGKYGKCGISPPDS